MQAQKNTLGCIIFLLTVIAAVLGIYYYPFNGENSGIWTVYIYSTPNPDRNFMIRESTDIPSREECRIIGLNLVPPGGTFECGRECEHRSSLGSRSCVEVCSPRGEDRNLVCN